MTRAQAHIIGVLWFIAVNTTISPRASVVAATAGLFFLIASLFLPND